MKVLWCHFWLIFEGSFPTGACFHLENSLWLVSVFCFFFFSFRNGKREERWEGRLRGRHKICKVWQCRTSIVIQSTAWIQWRPVKTCHMRIPSICWCLLASIIPSVVHDTANNKKVIRAQKWVHTFTWRALEVWQRSEIRQPEGDVTGRAQARQEHSELHGAFTLVFAC